MKNIILKDLKYILGSERDLYNNKPKIILNQSLTMILKTKINYITIKTKKRKRKITKISSLSQNSDSNPFCLSDISNIKSIGFSKSTIEKNKKNSFTIESENSESIESLKTKNKKDNPLQMNFNFMDELEESEKKDLIILKKIDKRLIIYNPVFHDIYEPVFSSEDENFENRKKNNKMKNLNLSSSDCTKIKMRSAKMNKFDKIESRNKNKNSVKIQNFLDFETRLKKISRKNTKKKKTVKIDKEISNFQKKINKTLFQKNEKKIDKDLNFFENQNFESYSEAYPLFEDTKIFLKKNKKSSFNNKINGIKKEKRNFSKNNLKNLKKNEKKISFKNESKKSFKKELKGSFKKEKHKTDKKSSFKNDKKNSFKAMANKKTSIMVKKFEKPNEVLKKNSLKDENKKLIKEIKEYQKNLKTLGPKEKKTFSESQNLSKNMKKKIYQNEIFLEKQNFYYNRYLQNKLKNLKNNFFKDKSRSNSPSKIYAYLNNTKKEKKKSLSLKKKIQFFKKSFEQSIDGKNKNRNSYSKQNFMLRKKKFKLNSSSSVNKKNVMKEDHNIYCIKSPMGKKVKNKLLKFYKQKLK